MECDFFLRVNSGMEELALWALLSPKKKLGPVKKHTHHTELITQSPQRFDPMFHGDEFCAEYTSLNSWLLLGNPLDKSQVTVNQDSSA
jgi:hypothetical protein